MKVLILGGTGTISREIVRQSLQAGHRLTLVNRGSRKTGYEDQVRTIAADRHSPDFAQRLGEERYDVVIDMICFTEEDARQTVALFGGKCRQLIVTSSVAAYERPTRSIPIREKAETLRTDPQFIYGFNKAQIERYLDSQKDRMPAAVTVIRPSFTFGRGTANLGMLRQNRNLVRRICQDKPLVMIGEGTAPWSFTFAEDLARAYVLAMGRESTYGKTYHVTNTELVTWEDLYRAMGRILGREVRLCYIPSALLGEMAPDLCGHLAAEKAYFNYYSVEKFRRDVPEYEPRVRLEEGLRGVLSWWEETDFPYDEAKERVEDRLCAAYEQFRQEVLRAPCLQDGPAVR